MRALELEAEIDEQCHLEFDLPAGTPAGPVRVLLLIPDTGDDDAGFAWVSGISHEWRDELADSRQDIYTLTDGEPVLAGR
jgi:hypothetical protein